jgi:peptide chain release factor 1
MKASLWNKLALLKERREELGALLSDPKVISQQQQYRVFSKEYADLDGVTEGFLRYESLQQQITENQALLKDPEFKELAMEESAALEQEMLALEEKLMIFLLPHDPRDEANIYLEIRAGAGGDEAALFVGDLFRMYSRYAQQQRWSLSILQENTHSLGGYREIIAKIDGAGVYGQLKFESGTHRVQRVPETEAQGRVHTSTCTVAILSEIDPLEEIVIDPSVLRVDTYRSSGAGGQHVNKTESAIRITHLPSGLVVECQEERSQHKNRAKAMALLQAKLANAAQEKKEAEEAATRKKLVGTGDRSERIRTYNFPQGRLTDHRIQLTLYQLEAIMEGHALGQVLEALQKECQSEQLSSLQ